MDPREVSLPSQRGHPCLVGSIEPGRLLQSTTLGFPRASRSSWAPHTHCPPPAARQQPYLLIQIDEHAILNVACEDHLTYVRQSTTLPTCVKFQAAAFTAKRDDVELASRAKSVYSYDMLLPGHILQAATGHPEHRYRRSS